jgi:cation transporter-like permease
MGRLSKISRPQLEFTIYAVIAGLLVLLVSEVAAWWLMDLMGVPALPQFIVAALIGLLVQQTFEHKVVEPLRRKARGL